MREGRFRGGVERLEELELIFYVQDRFFLLVLP